jgi:hypothetical protein
MIDAKELRIGNIVLESNSYTPGPNDFYEINVASINDIDKVVRDDQGNGYSYEALYPINLNETWLLTFGFNKSDQKGLQSFYILDNVCIGLYDNAADFGFTEEGVFNNFAAVYYVHELQNLYWAVTRSELVRR